MPENKYEIEKGLALVLVGKEIVRRRLRCSFRLEGADLTQNQIQVLSRFAAWEVETRSFQLDAVDLGGDIENFVAQVALQIGMWFEAVGFVLVDEPHITVFDMGGNNDDTLEFVTRVTTPGGATFELPFVGRLTVWGSTSKSDLGDPKKLLTGSPNWFGYSDT